MSKIKAKHRPIQANQGIDMNTQPKATEEVVDQVEAQAEAQVEEVVEQPAEVSPIVEEVAIVEVPEATEAAVAPAPAPEVKKAAVEAEPVKAVEAPAPTPVTETKEDESEEIKYLNNIRANGTESQKRILAAVESFANFFVPRAELVAKAAVTQQFEFLRHIQAILEKEYEEFRGCWNVLLVYFSAYHGAPNARNYTPLSEFSTNRYLHAWTKGEDKCNAYRSLVTLLRATRNISTRKHDVKTINFDAIGKNVLSGEAIANLKKFYGV